MTKRSDHDKPAPSPATVDQPAEAGIDWKSTHLWQLQPVRDLLMLGAVFGVLYLGYLLRLVTVPMLMALALAYLFEPLVCVLTKRRAMSRPGAALAIILAALVMIVVPATLGAGYAAVKGAAFAGDVAESISRVQASIAAPGDEELRAQIEGKGWLSLRDYIVQNDGREAEHQATVGGPDAGSTGSRMRTLSKQAVGWLKDNAAEIGRTMGQRVIGSGATAVGAALNILRSAGMLLFSALLTAFFFYFFVSGWGKVQEFWAGLIPERRKGRTIALLSKMDNVIAGFVRGRITIVGILMCWMTFAYAMIGVPAWYILGPVVGALLLVPFMHVIGVPAAMLLMWLEPGSMLFGFQQNWWWIVFAPIGVYLMTQMLDDYVLSPAIQGKNTDMDTPSILFASLAGGALAGIYGLLIAIPVAACIKILLREVFWPRFKAWGQHQERDFLPIERG
jgi:predicted PurR-regulated permease PerM